MALGTLEHFVKKRFVVLSTNIKCREKNIEVRLNQKKMQKNLCKIFDVGKNAVKKLDLYIKRNNIW